ncbi:MAG: High-affinity branched-chain amino acid transport system permease protein LivH, partial [uncultured Acetobacteraceae bacterium]
GGVVRRERVAARPRGARRAGLRGARLHGGGGAEPGVRRAPHRQRGARQPLRHRRLHGGVHRPLLHRPGPAAGGGLRGVAAGGCAGGRRARSADRARRAAPGLRLRGRAPTARHLRAVHDPGGHAEAGLGRAAGVPGLADEGARHGGGAFRRRHHPVHRLPALRAAGRRGRHPDRPCVVSAPHADRPRDRGRDHRQGGGDGHGHRRRPRNPADLHLRRGAGGVGRRAGLAYDFLGAGHRRFHHRALLRRRGDGRARPDRGGGADLPPDRHGPQRRRVLRAGAGGGGALPHHGGGAAGAAAGPVRRGGGPPRM